MFPSFLMLKLQFIVLLDSCCGAYSALGSSRGGAVSKAD